MALEPTLDSIWRMHCREYSQRYHTPLNVVMNELDPMIVMQALAEDRYRPSIVDEELDELMDILYKAKDPTYSRMSQEEIEGLVDAVMNKEIQRAAKKKRPTQETIEAAVKIAEAKPKKGSMNFGDLEKMDAATEGPKSGFEG